MTSSLGPCRDCQPPVPVCYFAVVREPAQLPLHVGQVQAAGLVYPQPHSAISRAAA
jgi:hypothetical protein